MGVFTRSRAGSILGGIAVVGVSAVFLAGCAGDSGGGNGTSEPAGESLDLKIGTALPVTGNLAFLGPPEIAGTEYAASEVNAANAGVTIEMIQGDSGDTDNKAYETEIPRLLNEGVSAIIGAASSGTSLQFIDQVVGAGVIQFSPANTSAAFSTYDDNGLYFRTAPSDTLQGEVLGNLIAESGAQTLGMIVLNDS
ncbi:MAG TPA: amino acid ABC transporter substrate-binding protein, partial [Microbacterium sp.]|nr:amino acid ABC transporter substrate-binding protein [Microbacterium sp.]